MWKALGWTIGCCVLVGIALWGGLEIGRFWAYMVWGGIRPW